MALAEDALSDRHAAITHFAQTANVFRRTGGRAPGSAPCPGPPVLVRGRAVERAAPRDGDILLLESVDERRIVHALRALPTSVDDGQVFGRVCAELERRALRKIQVDIALEVNRAGQKRARRHDDATAARAVTGRYGLAYGLRIVCRATGARAVIRDLEVARGTPRRTDACEYGGHSAPACRDVALSSVTPLGGGRGHSARAHRVIRMKHAKKQNQYGGAMNQATHKRISPLLLKLSWIGMDR